MNNHQNKVRKIFRKKSNKVYYDKIGRRIMEESTFFLHLEMRALYLRFSVFLKCVPKSCNVRVDYNKGLQVRTALCYTIL